MKIRWKKTMKKKREKIMWHVTGHPYFSCITNSRSPSFVLPQQNAGSVTTASFPSAESYCDEIIFIFL